MRASQGGGGDHFCTARCWILFFCALSLPLSLHTVPFLLPL